MGIFYETILLDILSAYGNCCCSRVLHFKICEERGTGPGGIDYRYFCNSDIFVSGGIYEITVGTAYDLPYRKDAVKK